MGLFGEHIWEIVFLKMKLRFRKKVPLPSVPSRQGRGGMLLI